MRSLDFTTGRNVDKLVTDPNYPLDTDTRDLMFSDTIYGLSNVDNYNKWDQLMAYQKPINKNLFKNELKAYFNLNQAQVDSIETNWNAMYESRLNHYYDVQTPFTNYKSNQGIAYWQWANSQITESLGQGPSVALVTDTVAGYPELSYFKTEVFMKATNP